ncbi:MAG: RNA-directed DNA polymerase [Bacteroidales bacterium]|nr:RNA-directed DNA polymerase [Bacteroidales bacterium]
MVDNLSSNNLCPDMDESQQSTACTSLCSGVTSDALFPEHSKAYSAFMDELSSEAVYEGLVAQGMFGDKIPPALTSEPFYQYCVSRARTFNKNNREWVTYRYARSYGRYREFGVPNPFAYEELSKYIADHWEQIKAHLHTYTADQTYKVSRIHVRKQRDSACIFEMNYKPWWQDYNPVPTILIGKRFVAECDISRCFPSIYTHAIDWAVNGREAAKKNKRSGSKTWAGKLDCKAAAIKYGETQGLLIGPHASNILSELVLTRIDSVLFANGYRFIRNIDDYTCYTETREKAEQFVIDLEGELSRYRLSLNQRKTRISILPSAISEDWVHVLKNYRFLDNKRLTYRDIESFMDTAVMLMEQSGGNQSVVLYAMRMIARKQLKQSARRYYIDLASHLVCLYPYLLPQFEQTVIEPFCMDDERIRVVSEAVYSEAMRTRDYLSASYALYFAAKYKFILHGVDSREIVEAEDCLLLLFTFLYACELREDSLREELLLFAEGLVDDKSSEAFDRLWLFAYEALPVSRLPQGDWRGIKKASVSFVDADKLTKPDFSMRVAQDQLEELFSFDSDNHGEDDPAEEAPNEL